VLPAKNLEEKEKGKEEGKNANPSVEVSVL